jgi:lipopolysaccharide transport protein LptA/LPS export ABC transporter protein LptC
MDQQARSPRRMETDPSQGIATAGDRAREFSRARRHSALVRMLRVGLPAVSVLAVAGYAATLLMTSGFSARGVEVSAIQIDTKNLTMQHPKYVGFGKSGERFEIRARDAVADFRKQGPLRLNAIDGDITQTNGVITRMKAAWGTYDQKKELLELYDKIDIDGSTGMKARLTRATVYTKENRVTSDEPIYAEMDTGSIRANTMVLNAKSHQATFKDAVRVRLKPNRPAPGADAAAKARTATALPGLAANSGQPIEVTSRQLDVDDTAKTALFRRDVVARQGDATLSAPELDVLYSGRASLDGPAAPGASASAPPAIPSDSAKLKSIQARGRVLMTNKDDRAESDTVDYDAANEKIILNGNVVMTSVNERRVTTHTVEIDQKADTALLTGNVVVTQGRNVMRSRRLFTDRKAGRTRLDSPAQDGLPAARISTLFYQNEQKAHAIKAPKADESANSLFSTTFKTDPGAPIDVSADTLDIFDQKKNAVYHGDVIARQGEFVVRTSEMTAYYSGQANLAGNPAVTAKADPGQQGGAQLTRIEARQKVVVTAKDGQRATGDWADFDVKTNKVVIGGKVLVFQGKNVVEGTRLVIDLTSGQSSFEQAPDGGRPPVHGATASLPGQKTPGASRGAVSSAVSGGSSLCPPGVVCSDGVIRTKQRVRAVIYPKDVEAKGKQKAKELVGAATASGVIPSRSQNDGSSSKSKKPAEATSSWDSTTTRDNRQ